MFTLIKNSNLKIAFDGIKRHVYFVVMETAGERDVIVEVARDWSTAADVTWRHFTACRFELLYNSISWSMSARHVHHTLYAFKCIFKTWIIYIGVFRGGARCDAPLWPDHENFLQATLYEKMRFLPFSSKNCKIQQCLIIFCVSKFQQNGRICGFH